MSTRFASTGRVREQAATGAQTARGGGAARAVRPMRGRGMVMCQLRFMPAFTGGDDP